MRGCFFKIQKESERGGVCGEILILGDSWAGCSAVYVGECLNVWSFRKIKNENNVACVIRDTFS